MQTFAVLIAFYPFLLPISNLILNSSCYLSCIHVSYPSAPWKSGLFMSQGLWMYFLACNILPKWLPLARIQYAKHFIYIWNIQKAAFKSSSSHPLPTLGIVLWYLLKSVSIPSFVHSFIFSFTDIVSYRKWALRRKNLPSPLTYQ